MPGVSLSPIYARIQNTIDRLDKGMHTPQIAAAIKNLKAAGEEVRSSCPRTMTLPIARQVHNGSRHAQTSRRAR